MIATTLTTEIIFVEPLIKEDWVEAEFQVYTDGRKVINLWTADDLTSGDGREISIKEYCNDWGFRFQLEGAYNKWLAVAKQLKAVA